MSNRGDGNRGKQQQMYLNDLLGCTLGAWMKVEAAVMGIQPGGWDGLYIQEVLTTFLCLCKGWGMTPRHDTCMWYQV